MAKAKRSAQEKSIPSEKKKPTRSVAPRKPSKKSLLNDDKSSGLTDIIQGLSVAESPGSPMRIDPEDFEKDGEGQTGFEVNGGSKSQPQTVNDKLRQAKNFLSDKDANRRLEFPSRYEKIDKFLQLIAKERIECDGKLYDEVQAMVQVHRSRVNRAKVQNTRRPDSSLPPLQSDRLSLIDTSVREHFPGAPLRDDHPPFTLERPVDQNLFIKALHSPASGDSGAEARRAELLKIESDGFLETLKNPSLVHEWIEESESQTRDERFNARATRRGRRRAAIRMALRSFATNCEQHHKGRWDRCDFRLPSSPVVKSPGGSLVFAKTKNSQKDSERSLSWTEKYQNYLQAQRDRPQDRNDRSSEELAQPHHGNQPISIKRRAMDILRAEIRKENQENKQRFQSISDMDWDPPENTGAGKPYVSLDRWPGTASKSTTETSEQSSKSRLGSGTSLGSREVGEKSLVREISQVQSNSQTHKRPRRNQGLPVTVRKPPEKFFRGEPAFTFAETPFLQAVTSKWIEHDIGSGKPQNTKPPKGIQLPSTRFSLPEPAFTSKTAAAFDPRRGHIRHLRQNFYSQPKFQTEHVPKGKNERRQITNPKAWVTSPKLRAPFPGTNRSRQIYQAWKEGLDQEYVEGMDLVKE